MFWFDSESFEEPVYTDRGIAVAAPQCHRGGFDFTGEPPRDLPVTWVRSGDQSTAAKAFGLNLSFAAWRKMIE